MANMHLVTGYAGKTHITAADHGSLHAALFGGGNYVLDRGSKFAATVVTNNKITIADGDIIIQGRHARLNEGITAELTIENGAQGFMRWDMIAVRYTKDSASGVEEANLVVIKGTAVSANPADPAYNTGNLLNGDAATVDVPLYRVVLNGLNVQELVPLFTAVGVGGDGATAVYTHSKSGSTHNFTGAGSNGKALIKSAFAAGDKIAVNGKVVPAFFGADEVDDLPVGRWVYFAFDGEQVNFKGGGGLGNAKLAGATATEENVVAGKTFFAGDKAKKTGTLPEYVDQYITANRISLGSKFNLVINRGAYTFNDINDDDVFIQAANADVRTAIGLTKAGQLVKGNSVLGLTGTGGTLAGTFRLSQGASTSTTYNVAADYTNTTYMSGASVVKAGKYLVVQTGGNYQYKSPSVTGIFVHGSAEGELVTLAKGDTGTATVAYNGGSTGGSGTTVWAFIYMGE